MGRGAGRGPGASPAQFSQISALQSNPKSTVTQLAVHDYDFLHQDHHAYSNDFTCSNCYLFWNLKSDNDGFRYRYFPFPEAISSANERGLSYSSESVAYLGGAMVRWPPLWSDHENFLQATLYEKVHFLPFSSKNCKI